MIIGMLAIFAGIQGGLVFSNFFLLVTSKLTSAKGLYLYWPTEAIIVTTVTFIILFFIVSTFTPMFIRTRKQRSLLRELTKRRAKKTIYTHFTICFNLSRTMLLYCRLSARLHNRKNAQNGSVFLIMLSILPLVVIGTYLFFHKHFFSLSIF